MKKIRESIWFPVLLFGLFLFTAITLYLDYTGKKVDFILYLLLIPVGMTALYVHRRFYLYALILVTGMCITYSIFFLHDPISTILNIITVGVSMVCFCEIIYRGQYNQYVITKELHERKQHFLTIIQNAKDILFVLDQHAQITFLSPSFTQILGWDVDEYLHKPVLDIIHPHDQPPVTKLFDDLKTGASPEAIEIRMLTKLKLYRDLEINLSTITDKQEFRGIHGIARDITYRKKFELVLMESLDLVEKAQVIARIGFWRSNVHSSRLFWSEGVFAITGIDQEHFDKNRESFTALIHPDDRDRVALAVQQAIEYQIPYDIQHRIIRPDGEIRWLHERAEIITDANQQTQEMLGTVQDITDQKMVEDELKILFQKFRVLFEHAGEGLLIVNEEGLITEANPRSSEMLGYDNDELIGKNPDEFIDPNAEEPTRKIDHSKANHQLYETVYLKKTHEKLPVEIGESHFQVDETPNKLLVIRDISERKKMEQERKLFEENMHHAQKLEAVGQLAGGIAHDFNNLLTAIIGNLQLAKTMLPEKEAKYVHNALIAANRSADLVQKLLAFGRKTVMNIRPLSVPEIMGEVYSLAHNSIDKRIKMQIHLDPDLPFIKADSSQIIAVVMNLCMNARDAIISKIEQEYEEANIQDYFIYLSATVALHHNQNYVVIAVQDNGIGIDESIQDKIFDPFFTTKEFGSQTVGGTGLGLASVYGIIKQHKGWIECDSTLGKGTKFSIYLPTHKPLFPESQSPIEYQNTTGDEHILLIDHDGIICELAKTILEPLGYTIHTEMDSFEGLAFYENYGYKIDLLIVDLSLSLLSGKEVIRCVRELNSKVPILVFCDQTLDPDDVAFDQLSVNGFINKPFKPDVLITTIRDILNLYKLK